MRASTVREPGEYAVRGGILDLFPPGMDMPVRLDFFGDTLETIRTLRSADAAQRTASCARSISCRWPNSSSPPRPSGASAPAMSRQFGAADARRPALRSGERRPPLSRHGALAAAVPRRSWRRCSIICRARRWRSSRWPKTPRTSASRRSPTTTTRAQRGAEASGIGAALQAAAAGPALSRPKTNGSARLDAAALARLTPFAVPEAARRRSISARAPGTISRPSAPSPAPTCSRRSAKHVAALQAAGKRVVIALWSEGARERMSHVLADHKLANLTPVASWPEALALPKPQVALAVLGIESRLRDRRRRGHQRAGHPRRPPGAAAPRAAPRREFHRRGDQPLAPAISSCMSITASAASSACRRSRPPARRTTASKSITPSGAKLYPAGREHRAAVALRLGGERASSSTGSAAAAGRRARRA